MSNSIASTSQWIWDSKHSIYYNPITQQYAQPQPDGKWIYSEIETDSKVIKKTTKNQEVKEIGSSRSLCNYEDIDEGDYDNFDGEEILPVEEQEEDRWSKIPLLRLIVSSSTVIPSAQTIVLVDPSEPLSIGRDKCHSARIRLKELEVSKSHAVLFWYGLDGLEDDEGCWGVSDSGSMHGTYLSSDGFVGKGKRLSEAKTASTPYALHHLDSLIVGSTRFIIHIHSEFACQSCTVLPDSSNLVPLHSIPDSITSTTPKVYESVDYSTKSKAEKEQIRREQMKGLKDQFLQPSKSNSSKPLVKSKFTLPTPSTMIQSTNVQSLPTSTKSNFVDRSAARRLRDGSSNTLTLPSPFFQIPGSNQNSISSSSIGSTFSSLPTPTVINPFEATSRGALLLAKLSTSTTSTTTTSDSRIENKLGNLIQAKTFAKNVGNGKEERPGLGSRNLVVIGSQEIQSEGKRGWREDVREANRKRFKEME